MKAKGSIKTALKGKGIHQLAQKEQKKIKSSNYLLDARETATACSFQKSLIQAYRECKMSPDEKRHAGEGSYFKEARAKSCSKATKAQLWIILARGKRLPLTRWLGIK